MSGPADQYDKFDGPDMVGKLISARIFNRGATAASPVRQLIITEDFLDGSSKKLIDQLKALSGVIDTTFKEYGAWQIYTHGEQVYSSDPFLKGDALGIPHMDCIGGLRDLLRRIESLEGPGFVIEDVDFFHTHLEPGELFNEGDVGLHDLARDSLRGRIESGGTMATYAVPTKGTNIFRHAEFV